MALNNTDLIKLAAKRRAALDAIVVDHPVKIEAHQAFEFLIEHAKLREQKGKLCLPLFGPSQAGKSTIIETFATQKNTEEVLAQRRIPVLHVTLEANVTRKGLAQNILEAIQEYGWATGPQTGSEAILLQRVRHYLRVAGVELLVLDEFHHLVHSESERLADSVGETIKRMLIKGVCPIVLSGVGEPAKRPFKNKQLQQRALPAVNLRPLHLGNPSDVITFPKFLATYLKNIERAGVARNATILTRGDIPDCLDEVSQGVLGATCNLIKAAIVTMTYAGRDELHREDLIQATDANFVAPGLYRRNPFVAGLGPMRDNPSAASATI